MDPNNWTSKNLATVLRMCCEVDIGGHCNDFDKTELTLPRSLIPN